ncbi:MAG: ZIP family metal transporter [Rhodoferax sp.]
MLLLSIVLGTAVAGIASVLLAAWISPNASSRFAPDMLSFAAGALLSTACMHLLPEALSAGVPARTICIVVLAGFVLFFVLDNAELWHHGHEHPHHDGHHHHHHGAENAKAGVWAVLVGDSVHCFADGLLIAAAFMARIELGALASLAVLAHEIPHHLGDLAVVRQGDTVRRGAVVKVALAGSVTVLAGVVGYALQDALQPLVPYFLAAAASSFTYVALADLVPQLQKNHAPRQAYRHIVWMLLGIALVAASTTFDVV